MANKPTSLLPMADALDGTEVFKGVQDGNSRKFDVDLVAAYIANTYGLDGLVGEWAPQVTADAYVCIPIRADMTIDQGIAAIGGATITFAKSTAADPDSFTSCTLPEDMEAGSWLKVEFADVEDFAATHLVRTA